MLEIIEKRISCYVGGRGESKPVAADAGQNYAVTVLPPDTDAAFETTPVTAVVRSAAPTSLTVNDFWYNTTTDAWAYATTTQASGIVVIDSETDLVAMNAAISSNVLSNNNLGVWNSFQEVRDALDNGVITLEGGGVDLFAIGDGVYQVDSYDQADVMNDELPGGIHPVVKKTDAADQVVFGKLVSVTPDGTECTVIVKGRNIIFAASGTDDNAVAGTDIGKGMLSTTTVGKVSFGAAAGSRDAKEVGHVVGGTNQNLRVDLG